MRTNTYTSKYASEEEGTKTESSFDVQKENTSNKEENTNNYIWLFSQRLYFMSKCKEIKLTTASIYSPVIIVSELALGTFCVRAKLANIRPRQTQLKKHVI
jgi:hypothetical protein